MGPRGPASASNWLRFPKANPGPIRHNLFTNNYLRQFQPKANWLRFAQQPPRSEAGFHHRAPEATEKKIQVPLRDLRASVVRLPLQRPWPTLRVCYLRLAVCCIDIVHGPQPKVKSNLAIKPSSRRAAEPRRVRMEKKNPPLACASPPRRRACELELQTHRQLW